MFRGDRLELEPLVEPLAREGAISIPILAESFRRVLLAEAKRAPYRAARPIVGSGKTRVRQRMGVFNAFSRESAFLRLRDGFQRLWDESLDRLTVRPFPQPPAFNDLMLQVYQAGSEGITPHLDRTAYRNIICLFVIAGNARFGVCADREGHGRHEVLNPPGSVILIRAPGFLGSTVRPFHFVDDIRETRYVFGLRHEVERGEGGH